MLVEGKISFFISIVKVKPGRQYGTKMKSSSRYFHKSNPLLCEIAFAIVAVE